MRSCLAVLISGFSALVCAAQSVAATCAPSADVLTYPANARALRIQGTVRAQFRTGSNGEVESVSATGHPLFVAEVERAIRAIPAGQCGDSAFEITVDFEFDARLPADSVSQVTKPQPAHFVVKVPAPTITLTISEPATVKLADLFREADVVAIVKVLSGDSEHYPSTTYRAEVIDAFKGVRPAQKLYFGPYIGYRVGDEYVAFLLRSSKELKSSADSNDAGLSYGTIDSSYIVMYEGYSAMPVQYVCAFGGKGPNERCDYGVKINTYQVPLPKRIKTYSLTSGDEAGGDSRWLKRKDLVSLLNSFR